MITHKEDFLRGCLVPPLAALTFIWFGMGDVDGGLCGLDGGVRYG